MRLFIAGGESRPLRMLVDGGAVVSDRLGPSRVIVVLLHEVWSSGAEDDASVACREKSIKRWGESERPALLPLYFPLLKPPAHRPK